MIDSRKDILSEVIWSKLQAATQQMALTMTKTSRSPIFAETHDFSTAVLDNKGSLIAQSLHNPFLLASVRAMVRVVLDYFAFDIQDGDVIVLNDPYYGGTHVQDLTVVMPTFYKDELIIFPAVQGHMMDIGGVVPGGYNPQAFEIWQEGIRVTPIKLYKAGVRQKDIEKKLIINSRMEEVFLSDLNAMIAACNVGRRNIIQILDKYGVAAVQESLRYIIDYSEKRFCKGIEELPEGTYEGEAYLDHDCGETTDIKIHASLIKKKGGITVDLRGSAPQVKGFVNSPLSNTVACVLVPILTIVAEYIPPNEGIFRPIQIIAPGGTVVNPTFPAPVGWSHSHIGAEISQAVSKALEKMVPERVAATSTNLPQLIILEKREDGSFSIDQSVYILGGCSGTPGSDGWGYPSVCSGIVLSSIEMKESHFPVQILERVLVSDSGGAGKFRGGLGTRVGIEFRSNNLLITSFVEGIKYPPPGYTGGRGGKPNSVIVKYPSGQERAICSALIMEPVEIGTKIFLEISGGGGWGNPRERDPELVKEDLLNGYISEEGANEEYGIVQL